MQGMLRRRIGKKGVTGGYAWMPRFVVLRRGKLYVADSEAVLLGGGSEQLAASGGVAQQDAAAAAVSEGVFDLQGACMRVLPLSEQGRGAPSASALALTSGIGSIVFACADEEELAQWCGTLYYAAALANGGGFTMHLAAHKASGTPYVAPEMAEDEIGSGGSGRSRGRTLTRTRSLSNGFGLLNLDNPFAFFGSPRSASSSRSAASVPRPQPASPDAAAAAPDEVRVSVRDDGTPAVSVAPVSGSSSVAAL